MTSLSLTPVDALDVTVLVDNSIDILAAPSAVERRPAFIWEWSARDQLRSEHGYALLVRIHHSGESSTLLYDAGLGRDTVLHNLDVLGVDVRDVRAAVLSHGHADHHSGLEGLHRRLHARGMPLVVHPDAWRDRKITFPNGSEIHMPPPSRADLDREGWQIVEERGPTMLLDGCLLVTGQVERTTAYETGFPPQVHQARVGERWEPDGMIADDQAVVVEVRGKGLVVMSSCSHAGAINVLRHARRLTGVEHVHAFVGGMHLTGGLFERIVPRTVQDLAALAPDYVVPGHCTGWRAQHAIVAQLPSAFLQSNVGTTFHFAA
jgi:7,8-dihydropterin-6-yl-methyl-4-(beta-D-ribofuranosyl)aminobenzene 5'-phosphate synthase